LDIFSAIAERVRFENGQVTVNPELLGTWSKVLEALMESIEKQK
jgi:hypothetical protein